MSKTVREQLLGIETQSKAIESAWPHFMKCAFGDLHVAGDQIRIGKDNDYVDADQMRNAVAWLAEQFLEDDGLGVLDELTDADDVDPFEADHESLEKIIKDLENEEYEEV